MNAKKILFMLFLGTVCFHICAVPSLYDEKEYAAFEQRAELLQVDAHFYSDMAKRGLIKSVAFAAPFTAVIAYGVDKLQSNSHAIEALAVVYGPSRVELLKKPITPLLQMFVQYTAYFYATYIGYRGYQRVALLRSLNSALTCSGYTVQKLELKQIMMVLAAHEHNVLMMQRLAPQTSDFLSKDGVWQALTELFIKDAATPETIQALQRAVVL